MGFLRFPEISRISDEIDGVHILNTLAATTHSLLPSSPTPPPCLDPQHMAGQLNKPCKYYPQIVRNCSVVIIYRVPGEFWINIYVGVKSRRRSWGLANPFHCTLLLIVVESLFIDFQNILNARIDRVVVLLHDSDRMHQRVI